MINSYGFLHSTLDIDGCLICPLIIFNEMKNQNSPFSSHIQLSYSTVEIDAVNYRSAIGTLPKIASMTRPDIQYAVNYLTECFLTTTNKYNAIIQII